MKDLKNAPLEVLDEILREVDKVFVSTEVLEDDYVTYHTMAADLADAKGYEYSETVVNDRVYQNVQTYLEEQAQNKEG
jgi:hypothetical protein